MARGVEVERPQNGQTEAKAEDEGEDDTSDQTTEDEVDFPLSRSTTAVSRSTTERIRRGSQTSSCNRFWRYQEQVYEIYKSDTVQYPVAFLIVLNFVMQCVQREIVPEHERQDVETDRADKATCDFFDKIFYVFNWIFLVELLVNMYGSWFWPFIEERWNQFDVVVVGLGVVDMLPISLPGPLRMVRMLRAFRIFRLFGRVESLRKILESLEHAAAGVANALFILVIQICIYAVLAVDLYAGVYCQQSTAQSTTLAPEPGDEDECVKNTTRGLCFGSDYYGNFHKSFYTMFQILTGESWSEAAVRPILQFYSSCDPNWLAYGASMLFFTSFMLINSFVLLNVFVAVLLDGMNSVEQPPPVSEQASPDCNEARAPADDGEDEDRNAAGAVPRTFEDGDGDAKVRFDVLGTESVDERPKTAVRVQEVVDVRDEICFELEALTKCIQEASARRGV